MQGELQVGGVFIRVFNQRGSSSANASNATVTAATATAAAAVPAASPAGAGHTGPLSVQQQPQQPQRGSGGGAAAFAGAAGSSGVPADPSGFCKALVRYLYDRLVERCFRGAELQQLPASEARNVLDVVTALSGEHAGLLLACGDYLIIVRKLCLYQELLYQESVLHDATKGFAARILLATLRKQVLAMLMPCTVLLCEHIGLQIVNGQAW